MVWSIDAEDAVRGRDGYQFDGQRLRCEIAKGDRGGGGGGRDRFDGISFLFSLLLKSKHLLTLQSQLMMIDSS